MRSPRFQHTYAADLPERLYSSPDPSPVSTPRLLELNETLARELGLDIGWLRGPQGFDMLAGNRFPADARPIAQAYAGHQFGNFVPQLGDGRAVLVGELVDTTGQLRDVQLKGSGPTRFSRNGDGRAALGPMMREYIVSEAMHALGIPTTRTLSLVATGEHVFRETRLPGALIARVAASHIRVGTFQYLAVREDIDGLRALADHAISRHYPHLTEVPHRYLGFLSAVVARQAKLVAQWMLTGFIHGVLNTDNVAISGETIDYGPCAFMDAYHPATVFSSIDHQGRYAFANQPRITVWNLARLAEALLPIVGSEAGGDDEGFEQAKAAIGTFQARYEAAFHEGMRHKIGLFAEQPEDLALAAELLDLMARNGADFTLTFRDLADEVDGSGRARDHFIDPTAFDGWVSRWRERLAREPETAADRTARMRRVNPKYIARNHRVEAAIAAATHEGDFGPFHSLLAVLSRPFDEQPEMEDYAQPPADEERVLQTFCGT
ncbi:protein adenylyltransferase SelO [Aminobacter sp. MET-1]|uniref:protein adenylyltransferase SelO n=1 Tax=Aminobacter sp. MET-1 TaxID=2951085 RepID=UPI00226AC3A2|nr:YdiU family protein [Aminobacter sp. MET-1]MCX8568420.1 YdiU family protein [Aminobacter sp. MET-1]